MVQPPINKNRLPPGSSFLGSHLTSFNFLYHSGFHWKIRGKYFFIDFNKGFNQI